MIKIKYSKSQSEKFNTKIILAVNSSGSLRKLIVCWLSKYIFHFINHIGLKIFWFYEFLIFISNIVGLLQKVTKYTFDVCLCYFDALNKFLH